MAEARIILEQTENVLEFLQKLKDGVEVVDKVSGKMAKNFATAFSSMQSKLKSINFENIKNGFKEMTEGVEKLTAPGMAFESAMAQLQSTTGITGQKLDDLGKRARANALIFGIDAKESLAEFDEILHKLSPELAKSPEQLQKMAHNTQLLAKTMKGDQKSATELLTGTMKQFGVSLKNPTTAAQQMTRMMNALSAASAQGSAKLPQLKDALNGLGTVSRKTGISFNQSLSAIQQLDKSGFKGAEGGKALKGVLNSISKEGLSQFEGNLKKAGVDVSKLTNNSTKFTEKLRLLKPILSNTALATDIFGKENLDAAKALIRSAAAQDKMTKSISGTNQTEIQAKPIMNTKASMLSRVTAKIDDYKIGIYNATKGMLNFLGPAGKIVEELGGASSIFTGLKTVLGSFGSSASEAASDTGGLSAATSKSKGILGGLGGLLSSTPWGAIAEGVLSIASSFWDVASGANEARVKAEEFKKGQEQGSKVADKYSKKFDKNHEKEIERIQNSVTSGDISEEEGKKKQLAVEQRYQKQLENKIKALNTKKGIAKDNLKNAQFQANLSKTFDPARMGEWLGADDTAEKEGKRRGRVANYDEQLKQIYELFDQQKSKTDSAAAEVKGMEKRKKEEKKQQELEKQSSYNSPKGYDSGNTDKTMSGGGGEIKNINVKIDSLVKGDLIFQNSTNENLGDLKKKVTEVLIGAVRDFEIAI